MGVGIIFKNGLIFAKFYIVLSAAPKPRAGAIRAGFWRGLACEVQPMALQKQARCSQPRVGLAL